MASLATVNGTTYKREDVVCYGIEDEKPLFGKIMQCLVTPTEETVLVICALNTSCWNKHFHSFEVC